MSLLSIAGWLIVILLLVLAIFTVWYTITAARQNRSPDEE